MYSSDNAFHELEDEMIKFSRNTKHIFLLGDFNSRTSKILDFVIPDENLAEILNTVDDELLLENMFSYRNFFDLNVPFERASEYNTRHNNYGAKLIEMCKRCAMFIANGRLFKDQNIGRMTSSLVDYLILAPETFKIITEFEILDINPMFSDIHKQLHFVVNLNEYAPLQNEKFYVQLNVIRWKANLCRLLWIIFC